MRLYDMLKSDIGIRMSCGRRWIVAGEESGVLEVYESKHGAKTSKVLRRTDNESEALRLVKG